MELKSVISLFLFLCLLGHLDCTELTVKGGADATLECSGHTDATSIMIRWDKSDLQSEDSVILFRDGRFQENLQHELFKGRVSMKDPKWKETGDFSVILKHVTTDDAGTYECEAGYDGQKPRSLNRVTLKVEISELTVKGGADATLECSGPTDVTSVMIRWDKSDLQSEDYVILFRDGQFQENLQHELFKGRVSMEDPKWKETGDFSVILKHVTTNDAGTYECEAGYEGQKPRSLNRVTLKVEISGQQGGHTEDEGKEDGGKEAGSVGLKAGLAVSGVLLVVAVVGFVIYRKHEKQKMDSYWPPADMQLV